MPSPILLDALNSTGCGLRATFQKSGDRWQHAIWRIDARGERLLLTSVEGSAIDDWPHSPAFQDLSREKMSDGSDVVFLIGKAGGSHWSASVEAHSNPPGLIFDLACRHTESPTWLGSRYYLAPGGEDFSIWNCDCLLDATRQLTVNGRLEIFPLPLAQHYPSTTRWKYGFSLPPTGH